MSAVAVASLPLPIVAVLVFILLSVSAIAIVVIAAPGEMHGHFSARRLWAWSVLSLLAIAAIPLWFGLALIALAPLAAALLISVTLLGEWFDRNQDVPPVKPIGRPQVLHHVSVTTIIVSALALGAFASLLATILPSPSVFSNPITDKLTKAATGFAMGVVTGIGSGWYVLRRSK